MEWLTREVTPAEDQMIQAFMAEVARAASDAEPRLADGKTLSAKAHLLRRWKAERTVQLPLDVMEPIQIAAVAAAAVLLFTWSLPTLLQFLGP